MIKKFKSEEDMLEEHDDKLRKALCKMTSVYRTSLPDIMKRHELIQQKLISNTSCISIRGASLGKFSMIINSTLAAHYVVNHQSQFLVLDQCVTIFLTLISILNQNIYLINHSYWSIKLIMFINHVNPINQSCKN